MMPRRPVPIRNALVRRMVLHAQRLDEADPFAGSHEGGGLSPGVDAVTAAVAHLGYVQIDTIAVVERCHHHILWSRIPGYARQDLHDALSIDKTIFEYWTHALSFVPSADLRFFLPAMKASRETRRHWSGHVDEAEVARLVRRIRRVGPLSIRDIEDDVPIEKTHAWASRKPSKKALQKAFLEGRLTIAERRGMEKKYELIDRHFGWREKPKPASERQVDVYMLERALRSQGVVSLDSVCHLSAARKPSIAKLVETEVRQRRLIPLQIESAEKVAHWVRPQLLETALAGALPEATPTHILSPFDPLIIQRKRLTMLFAYEHRFEAYVPAAKRVLGYFVLPVLHGDRIVAALDIKADRQANRLDIRRWHWIGEGNQAEHGPAIETALERFAAFQFAP